MVRPPYQTAARLSATAASNWQGIDGTYSGKGVDILKLPLSRFLSVVFTWCVERLTEEDRMRWLAELEAPLPEQENSAAVRKAELEQLKHL